MMIGTIYNETVVCWLTCSSRRSLLEVVFDHIQYSVSSRSCCHLSARRLRMHDSSNLWSCSATVSAAPCRGEGCGFESRQDRHLGGVANVGYCNRLLPGRNAGSIPVTPTMFKSRTCGKNRAMGLLLLVLAAICLIFGVINLVQGALLWGVILVVVGLFLGGGARTRF